MHLVNAAAHTKKTEQQQQTQQTEKQLFLYQLTEDSQEYR